MIKGKKQKEMIALWALNSSVTIKTTSKVESYFPNDPRIHKNARDSKQIRCQSQDKYTYVYVLL